MGQDLHLQCETFIPFAALPLAFSFCQCTKGQCFLTLAATAESTAEAIAVQ